MILVTGFFDLYTRENNNRYIKNANTYINNFIYLVSVIKKYKIIVYLDDSLKNYDYILSNIENIIIKYISINDLPLYKYEKQVSKCNLCQSYFNDKKYTPLYSIIVNSKFYLLKLAIDEYKNENCFSWIDFGCMHYSYIKECFNEEDMDEPIKNKIRFCVKSELYSQDKDIEYYFDNIPKVSGVFFGGCSKKLLYLYNFVNKIYLDFINSNRLIFEEHILGYYISKNYDDCQLFFGSSCDGLINFKQVKNNKHGIYPIFLKTFRNRNNRDPEIDEIPKELQHLKSLKILNL